MELPSLSDIDDIRASGFRPVVVGCILHGGKILFVYKQKYSLWQLPQGGIDNGETMEQAAMREMAEELGTDFAASLKMDMLVGQNQVEFPTSKQGTRSLKTDDGESVFMLGKKYFFVAIAADTESLAIDQTEFDDRRWLNHEHALGLAGKIYQKSKQHITIDALTKLRESGLL